MAVSETMSPAVAVLVGRDRSASATEHARPAVRVREVRELMPRLSLRAYQVRVQVSSPLLAVSPVFSAFTAMP
ncbi:hypothetical protein GCM10020295_01860 [Streptomyces cinereospinus]